MAESSQRFATLTENDVQQLLDEKEVKNTKRVTKMSQTAFKRKKNKVAVGLEVHCMNFKNILR